MMTRTQTRPHLTPQIPDLTSIKQKAAALAQSGDLAEAIALYRRIVALSPLDAVSLYQLAHTLTLAGRFAEAVPAYRCVLGLHPELSQAHHALGRALCHLGDLAAARESLERAVQLDPACAESLSDLASLYMDSSELAAAEVLLRRAVQLQPHLVVAQSNLGCLLEKRGDILAATECFRSALALEPHHVQTLCNLGSMLDNLGDPASAANCYRLALATQADHPLARFNLAAHLLADGHFAQGWQDYEARWLIRQFAGTRRPLTQPRWHGEDLHGKTIFLHAEQGLGDTIHFVRYVPLVAARGARIVLEVQPMLVNLLRASGIDAEILPQGTGPIPACDVHCPLMSLAGVFKTTLEDLPAHTPYLHPDPDDVQRWAHRITGNKLRVGLVWSGNPKHARDRLRSVPLDLFSPTAALPGVTLYSLQKGPAAAQQALLPESHRPVDLSEDLHDFTDTAAAIAHLDLVLTVDTAVSHLAGALGKPVWILIPRAADWRWLKDRTGSPWYPTARLFRQGSSGSWPEVLDRVRQELEAEIASRGREG